MQLYSFERLIDKYGIDCQLVNFTAGSWAAGVYTKGEKKTEDINGAIVPITEKRIQNSGGSYKQGDCEFITTQPITVGDQTYIVVNENEMYKLQDSTDYSNYADFSIYVARRVSAFDTAASTNTTKNA